MAEVNLIKFVGDNLFLVGVALVSGAMLVWPAVRRAGGSASVSTLQATLLMNQQNALVLDVREAAEYEKAHVLGALSRAREAQGEAGDRRVRHRQPLGQGRGGAAQERLRAGIHLGRRDRGLAASGPPRGEVDGENPDVRDRRVPVLRARGNAAEVQRRHRDREDPRRSRSAPARGDDGQDRPPHRAADLHRRAARRRIRRACGARARRQARFPARGLAPGRHSTGAPMSEAQQPMFSIEKIYVKDLSLEVPGGPQTFMQPEQPQLEVQLTQQSQRVNEVLFEVTLVVSVAAKKGDKTLFLVEVSQAGVFQIRNVPEADLAPVLGMVCPNVLFPYARETVSDVITRAGFPSMLLAPVNFEALYQQRAAESAAQPGGPRIEIAH